MECNCSMCLYCTKVEEMNMSDVTKNAAAQETEPAAKADETKAEKFIRIGEYRMNKAIDAIGRLENLANKSVYEYTQEQVEAMFSVLEQRVADIKAKFMAAKQKESASFSFRTNVGQEGAR